MVPAGGSGAGDASPPARLPGHRCTLPPPCAAGEDGGDRRHRLRRSPRDRPRRGWNSTETDAYGIELLPLRQRFDRFDEYCHVLTSLLENETTDFHGRYFSVSHGLLSPKAVQRPRPPILIGGNGERRTLRTVARFADHWNFVRGEPDVFARKLDVLREHCDEIGRDVDEHPGLRPRLARQQR